MFGKNISRTHKQLSCFANHAMLCWSHFLTRLYWSSSLERNAPKNFLWYFSWFLQFPLTHAYLVEPCSFCWIELLAAVDSCLVFAIKLDYWYPDNGEWTRPKELLLNIHSILFIHNLPFSLPLVSGLEGRLKHLRTLKK